MNGRRYRSSAEVKADFVASFPPTTGELADELSSSITFLHLKWKLFRALFGLPSGCDGPFPMCKTT